jgi:hypothetical protein
VTPNPHAFGVDDIVVGFFGVDKESCSKPGLKPGVDGGLRAASWSARFTI